MAMVSAARIGQLKSLLENLAIVSTWPKRGPRK
jgi:hypothetical protein